MDDKKDLEVQIASSDLTPKETRQLKAYISNGLPGLHAFDLDKQMKAKELYLAGRSYEYISRVFRIKKEAIMYVADKEQWYEQKIARIQGLALTLQPKLTIAQIESKHFLLDLIQFIHSYFQEKMEAYARTKDDRILETMNHKLLDKYHKTIELLYRLEDKDNKKPASTVSLNIPEGATVERVDSDTVQITPNNNAKKDLAQILEALAELNRARDEE
jgi:hypothetical protein